MDWRLAEILRSLTGADALPWATKAPYPWFCGMCDSRCSEGEVQIATVQRRRFRRPLIVREPVEWRHAFEGRPDVPWEAVSEADRLLAHHLSPNSALRWDPQSQSLQTVSGRIADRAKRPT